MSTSTEHPWQHGPSELISYAVEHMHRPSDFDQRVAFLLLDVGVETLFKVYLSLPGHLTGTDLPFKERREAVEGNFHQLLEGVSKAAGASLSSTALDHVRYYHNLRNRLYHEGDGITVPVVQVRGYAQVAVELLRVLLGVDLSEQLRKATAPTAPPTSTVGVKRIRSTSPLEQLDGDKHEYAALQTYLLQAREQGYSHRVLTFAQIERILSAELPNSARTYQAWWGNHYRNAQANAWLRAGWWVDSSDLDRQEVVYRQTRKAHYAPFFDDMLRTLKSRQAGITSASKVQPENWLWFSAGAAGFYLGWTIPRDPVLRTELYIDTEQKDRNKAAFDSLHAEKQVIETRVGETLSWERLENNRACRISVARPFEISDPSADRDGAIQWGVETAIRFREAFGPRIKDL
jgi:hypothetical protein